MSLPDSLPHLCDITRSVAAQDEYGGDYDVPETVESDRACWVQPASDREVTIYQRRSQNVTHKVYFRGNPGVGPGYIITPSNGEFSGKTLEVRSAAEATAGTGLLYRVMVEEIQPR